MSRSTLPPDHTSSSRYNNSVRIMLCGAMSVACMMFATLPSLAAPAPFPPSVSGYADLSDLAQASPIIVRAHLVSTQRLKGKLALGLSPGKARFLMTAAIDEVIKAPAALPPTVSYLWDAGLGKDGKAPALKSGETGTRIILFLTSVPSAHSPDGRAYRLVAQRAQIADTPAVTTRIKGIVRQVQTNPVMAQRMASIDNAFHIPAAGGGETQFIVKMADDRPLSVILSYRAGRKPTLQVGLNDLTQDNHPIKPDSLVWYHLACDLPSRLPQTALSGNAGQDARLKKDYLTFRSLIGACGRTKPATP